MKIEVGKSYRDKKGHVAHIFARVPTVKGAPTEWACPFIGVYENDVKGSMGAWSEAGVASEGMTQRHDLVAEHREPFETWVVVATRSNGHEEHVFSGSEMSVRKHFDYLMQQKNHSASTYRVAKLREVTP